MPDAKDIESHRKHLKNVSQEDRARLRKYYRLRPDLKETLPLICLRRETLGRDHAKWREFLHPLDPVSLDDLKNWFGIPNHLARRKLSELEPAPKGVRTGGHLHAVDKRLLPDRRGFSFDKLDNKQRNAVQRMTRNLLYTHVSSRDLEDKHVSAAAHHMVEIAKSRRPDALLIPDLVVCPDDVIVFDRISVVLFNNVVIYGNGQIRTIGHTKFHAFHLQHVVV